MASRTSSIPLSATAPRTRRPTRAKTSTATARSIATAKRRTSSTLAAGGLERLQRALRRKRAALDDDRQHRRGAGARQSSGALPPRAQAGQRRYLGRRDPAAGRRTDGRLGEPGVRPGKLQRERTTRSPIPTEAHVPAAVVADAVAILSNNWTRRRLVPESRTTRPTVRRRRPGTASRS